MRTFSLFNNTFLCFFLACADPKTSKEIFDYAMKTISPQVLLQQAYATRFEMHAVQLRKPLVIFASQTVFLFTKL